MSVLSVSFVKVSMSAMSFIGSTLCWRHCPVAGHQRTLIESPYIHKTDNGTFHVDGASHQVVWTCSVGLASIRLLSYGYDNKTLVNEHRCHVCIKSLPVDLFYILLAEWRRAKWTRTNDRVVALIWPVSWCHCWLKLLLRRTTRKLVFGLLTYMFSPTTKFSANYIFSEWESQMECPLSKGVCIWALLNGVFRIYGSHFVHKKGDAVGLKSSVGRHVCELNSCCGIFWYLKPTVFKFPEFETKCCSILLVRVDCNGNLHTFSYM